MDKNTITGLVLILLILIGFSYFTKPSQEEQARELQRRDSIARVIEVKRLLAEAEAKKEVAIEEKTSRRDTSTVFEQGETEAREIILENNKILLKINTLGGRIDYVELKEYVTHDSLPLILWQPKTSAFSLSFYANRREIVTEKMLFTPNTTKVALDAETGSKTLTMRLYANEAEQKYIEYVYTLNPDSYMLDFDIRTRNLDDIIDANSSFLSLLWGLEMPQLEKSKEFETRYTGVFYNFLSNEVDNVDMNVDATEQLKNKIKWIAYKQQFFSSVLIAKESFVEAELVSKMDESSGMLKKVLSEIPLPYTGSPKEDYAMQFYFGPNSFTTLKEYGADIQLHSLVDLGWKGIAWVNRYFVLPVFHFLEAFVTGNYGVIIFLLTLIIKLILFPLTYKSYLSQAKMRVLKPQIDEISAKFPSDKAMEKQQAVMAFYKKAGINPMGGCLPMLLQMPILIALFWFFPGAIELRQQSFLWATDLASYDSIYDLSFSIPFYGDHVSLFCLLMTVVNVIYMVMNNKNQPQNDQMKSMKIMMYIMPVMFLFIFNSYSSGLSYYYLIINLISIIQTYAIGKYVDDEKLLKKIELAKSKPVKKSNFQKRLEEAQRMQRQKLKQKQKK
ncbi:membrane protein insertase YidC [Bacteroidia bacterium]|nr:membrane protein insertase YidC [Bacteroidia bacterium]